MIFFTLLHTPNRKDDHVKLKTEVMTSVITGINSFLKLNKIENIFKL